MPYEKRKEERYRNFGGINNKVSQYLNGPMEFLSLENLDFQTPGSLTKRWGSTQLYGASYFQTQVRGLFEYDKVNGESYLIVAGSTSAYKSVTGGLTQFLTAISHASMANFATYVNFATFGVSLGPVDSYFQGDANYDFEVFNNQLYACNGKEFWRYNGQSLYYFGLPLIGAPYNQSVSAAFTWGVGDLGSAIASGITGWYRMALAYQNESGVIGNVSFAGQNASTPGINAAGGASGLAVYFTEQLARSMNPGYGVSSILIYMTQMQSSALNAQNSPLYYVASVGLSAASGSGLTYVITTTAVTNLGPTTAITDTIPYGRWYYADNYSIITQGLSYQLVAGVTSAIGSLANHGILADTKHGNMIPSMLESLDGTMFYAGASYFPSTLFWADFLIPERISADSNLEVRTDDGEVITAIKSYNGNLMIFKQSTFHQLNTSAEDPAGWLLTQVSAEYGCLSNRAVAEYQDYIVFLDRKGVIRYNGATIEIFSSKIDPIFSRMNVAACRENAKMTYDKQRNQILCDIPVDGATYANLTVVYDIISKAWTTYSGYAPASIARTQIPSKDTIIYGGYSGLVSYFGASFTTDNGVGFTCLAKSGFLTDMGNSVTKVFRRLFLDASPVGASSSIAINLYQDYGASKIVTRTMYQNPFQSRIDFGVSGKSLSVEFVMGSTFSLAMHGFTIEYRFQRAV